MSIAGYIITGLCILIFAVVAIDGFYLNHERKQYEKHIADLKKEGAENAKHNAEVIEQAEKDKSEVRTGDHAHDLHTMADKLHNYAENGK